MGADGRRRTYYFTCIDDFTKFTAPDTAELLPKEIQKYTLRSAIKDPNQPSFIQGSGHGGSHPHLCNEFVNAIVEGRQRIWMRFARQIIRRRICAQESADHGGAEVEIPDFAEEF